MRGHYIDLWFSIYGATTPYILKTIDINEAKSAAANTQRNVHLVSMRKENEDLLSGLFWHGTALETDEPDSPASNRFVNDLNEDMLS